MKRSSFLCLTLAIFLFWLSVITVFSTNLDTRVRLFSDEYDRYVYFQRGKWFINHQVPYRDVLSEYPQIPTYLFGFMHIFDLRESNLNTAYWEFSSFFSFLMLVVLIATIHLLHTILPDKKHRAYLLLLPAPLFFSFNRFDIMPAYLCLLSYKMIQDKKWQAAALLLGIGTLTKWYPALLLPAYLVFYYRIKKRINWQMIAVYILICLIIILPTILSGGIGALLVPYRFHVERGLETVSLPALISNAINALTNEPIDPKYVALTFLMLQVSVIPFALLAKIDKTEKLLNWCVLIICMFILFSRIYSPQWLLWIFPFYILAANKKTDLAVIVMYGITTYIGFPIIWDYFGSGSREMIAMGIVNIMFLILIVLTTIGRIQTPETFSNHPVNTG